MDTRVLQTLSRKLGVTNKNVLRKAEEYLRLLSVQSGSGMALSMSAKAVICLDISAFSAGSAIDKSTAIKLSGLKRTQYVSSSQTVNRLLNLSPTVHISDLCITHSATNAKELAHRVIKEYEQDLQNKNGVDLSLPLFQTAAVAAACRAMKIKVDKKKMYECSCSKRDVYNKLVEVMSKIAENLHAKKSVKSGTKRAKTLLELVEDNMQDAPASKIRKCSDNEEECNSDDEKDTNDFEAWKKKILAAAAASV